MQTETLASTLSPELLHRMNAYWRAANYLSVGQIYLYDNPLLKEPLKLSHVKPLVVGHWARRPARISSMCISTVSSRSMTWICFTLLVPGTAALRLWATYTSKAPGLTSIRTSPGTKPE